MPLKKPKKRKKEMKRSLIKEKNWEISNTYGVMIIVIGNGHRDLSSNPGCWHRIRKTHFSFQFFVLTAFIQLVFLFN